MEANNETKLYYSISEVAKELNVNASLLRFWEKEFPAIKPQKNKKGTRHYTAKDLETLKQIYYLTKECGYTLEGAKERMKNKKDQDVVYYETLSTLKNIRTFLTQLKTELEV